MAATSFPAPLCIHHSSSLKFQRKLSYNQQNGGFGNFRSCSRRIFSFSSSLHPRPSSVCLYNGNAIDWAVNRRKRAKISTAISCSRIRPVNDDGDNDPLRQVLQLGLWATEGVYIIWLFLLPFAPGDPVWAISSETISSLVGLSLNFFFILPLTDAAVSMINAPILHPMSEGLFNFVVAWTLMFAPLLYTDCKRDRYKGSLDVLWGFQMFLTNTFLIPYMAFRLNEPEPDQSPKQISRLGSVMVNGAPAVGLIGGVVCLFSVWWAFYGRMDGNFGGIEQRWEFLMNYLGSERLAYAFIWDIVLYSIFQPWLIGENLENLQETKVGIVNYLRFVPVIGLLAYLIFLNRDREADFTSS